LVFCVCDAPTVLRDAQGLQIMKKHGRTPVVFAAAFYDLRHLRCRSASAMYTTNLAAILYNLGGLTAPSVSLVRDDF